MTDDAGLANEVLFRPVRGGNAFEETVARMLQAVRLGVVEPGAVLPSERDLAARFSVSRDTVREAIRSLSDAGYLVSRRGRYGGTFVVDPLPVPVSVGIPPSAEIDDMLGLRTILEVGGARAAAARELTAAEREFLWTCLQESMAASADDYRRLDSRLHLAIAELARIPSLVSLLADNRIRINQLLDNIPLLTRNIDHSNRQHEEIVVAILTGSPESAASVMLQHLDGSAALLRAFLSEPSRDGS